MTQAPEDFSAEPPRRQTGAETPAEAMRIPAPRTPVDMRPPAAADRPDWGHRPDAPRSAEFAADRNRVYPPPPPGPPSSAARPPGPPPGFHYGFPVPHPRPEPPRRSRAVTFLIVLALVAGSVLSGAVVSGWRPTLPEPATGHFEAAPVIPEGGTLPSPAPDAPENERLAYLKEQAELVLAAHSRGLVDGSLTGWLQAFDPTLHAAMTTRYETLRDMGASRFDYRVTSGPLPDHSGAVPLYEVTVAVTHCFVEPADTCHPADVVFDTVWRDGPDGMLMVEVKESACQFACPHPWEVDELVAAIGDRTVVAVPTHMSGRLDDALAVSEEAAANADDWALWVRPDRYVVYIGGNDEFDSWFGNQFEELEDVLGFALPLEGTVDGSRQPSTYATVMNVDRTGWGRGLTSVIRHELGHAVTLWAAQAERYSGDVWWMVEGIAEYIDHGGRPVDDYDRISDVRRHVANGGCATDVGRPEEDDDTLAGSGKYGCAFLGVHYIIDTYGQEAFAEWFGASAREGEPVPASASDIFGKSYSELMEEITEFIAQTVLDRLLLDEADCRNMSNIPIERYQRHGP